MTSTPDDDARIIDSLGGGDSTSAQAARFAAWRHWRPSTAKRCPRVVAGKRCRAYTQRQDGICVCQRRYYPLLDHPRMWLTETGERVFTAEPYNFSGDDFAGLVAECSDLGLKVSVTGSSPYFPGRTILLIIRKRDRPAGE
jgi:hypothetical protein